jgi:hypothetical protein
MKIRHCIFLLFFAAKLSANTSVTDCYTITTIDGKTCICQIQQHNSCEITFSLCDDASGKIYSIPTERLASVHKLNKSAKVFEHLNTLPCKKTTHKNGAWVLLDATGLFKNGASVAYERQLSPRISYLLDVGMRWHDISPVSTFNISHAAEVTPHTGNLSPDILPPALNHALLKKRERTAEEIANDAFIRGIFSLVFAASLFASPLAIVVGLTAVSAGVKALKRTKGDRSARKIRRRAWWGIILGGVSAAFALGLAIWILHVLATWTIF